VLEQEELVGDAAGRALGHEAMLQGPRLSVRDAAQPARFDGAAHPPTIPYNARRSRRADR